MTRNQKSAYVLAGISFLILFSCFLPYTNIDGLNLSMVELTLVLRTLTDSFVLKLLGLAFAGYIFLHIANIFVLAHGFSRKLIIISSIYLFALTPISVLLLYIEYGDFYGDSLVSIIGENSVWMLQIVLFATSYYMHPASVDMNSFAVKSPVDPAKAPVLKLMNVWNVRGLQVELKSNGDVIGTYTIEKNRQSEEIVVPTLNVVINVKGHYEIPLELAEGGAYVLEIHQTQLKQYNNTGFLLRDYGCSKGMNTLCFFIPIVGFIIAGIKWKESPLYAKSAMRYALFGSAFGVLYQIISTLTHLV